jgi:hypothetical protein
MEWQQSIFDIYREIIYYRLYNKKLFKRDRNFSSYIITYMPWAKSAIDENDQIMQPIVTFHSIRKMIQ